MKVVDIKYVDRHKFSGKVNGVYCEIEINANLFEDLKVGYHDHGPIITKEDAIRIISDKLIKYYEDNIKRIRKEKLKKII